MGVGTTIEELAKGANVTTDSLRECLAEMDIPINDQGGLWGRSEDLQEAIACAQRKDKLRPSRPCSNYTEPVEIGGQRDQWGREHDALPCARCGRYESEHE